MKCRYCGTFGPCECLYHRGPGIIPGEGLSALRKFLLWRHGSRCGSAGSPSAIEHAVEDLVPHVISAHLTEVGKFESVIRVRLPWWTWLTFGWMHRRTRQRARVVVDFTRAVGAEVKVSVW